MPDRQNITSKNRQSEDKEENNQGISTASYYREKLQGFYNDCEIEEMRDWLENSVGTNNTLYNRE